MSSGLNWRVGVFSSQNDGAPARKRRFKAMNRTLHLWIATILLVTNPALGASPQTESAEKCSGLAQYDEKTACLWAVVEADPEDAYAFFALVRERDKRQDLEALLAEVNQLIDLRPDLAHLFLLRADLRRRVWGDVEGAEADLEIAGYLELLPDPRKEEAGRAIEPLPENADQYLKRARARYFLHDYEGTIEDCNVYLQLAKNPQQPYVYDLLCSSKSRIGNIDGAIDALSAKLESHPEFAESTLVRRAILKRRMGDDAGAASDEKAAKEMREKRIASVPGQTIPTIQ
jgi:hypothetical protein